MGQKRNTKHLKQKTCRKRDTKGEGNTSDSACQHCHDEIKINSICIYKYIYTHFIFQHSIDTCFAAPVPNVTPTNSPRSEQHNHNHTPTTMMPQQYTSCRGDCTMQTQLLSPHGYHTCSGGVAFTVVIFSAGPQHHKLGSQSIPFCQHLLTLQSLLHSPFLPISSPSSVSSPEPLLP